MNMCYSIRATQLRDCTSTAIKTVRDEQVLEELTDAGQQDSTFEAFFKLNKQRKEKTGKLPNTVSLLSHIFS